MSSMAIPSIMGVIMAVVTSKGIFKSHMRMAKTAKGKMFGMSTKSVVLICLINNQRQIKAAIKAAKKDLNWVASIKLFKEANTTANPLIFSWYSEGSKWDSKVFFKLFMSCSNFP